MKRPDRAADARASLSDLRTELATIAARLNALQDAVQHVLASLDADAAPPAPPRAESPWTRLEGPREVPARRAPQPAHSLTRRAPLHDPDPRQGDLFSTRSARR
jgi:hypothetical protein